MKLQGFRSFILKVFDCEGSGDMLLFSLQQFRLRFGLFWNSGLIGCGLGMNLVLVVVLFRFFLVEQVLSFRLFRGCRGLVFRLDGQFEVVVEVDDGKFRCEVLNRFIFFRRLRFGLELFWKRTFWFQLQSGVDDVSFQFIISFFRLDRFDWFLLFEVSLLVRRKLSSIG